MDQATTADGRTAIFEPVLSWPAIIAGALVAVATSIFLWVLAAGFGYQLSFGGAVSRGSLGAFTPELGAAAVAIQVVSAGLGGYLAGRLRHHWLKAHADEAHFRDTAQGLIAWALATLTGLVLAVSVLTPIADQLAGMVATAAPTPVDTVRAAHIVVQAALFTALGMLLGAFTAAAAARLGGLRTEEMLLKARP